MQTIVLYRYTRVDGGTTVSIEKPDAEYTETSRLIANDGYILTDGVNYAFCIDTDNPSQWCEVEYSEDSDEATITDYEDALRELGVNV